MIVHNLIKPCIQSKEVIPGYSNRKQLHFSASPLQMANIRKMLKTWGGYSNYIQKLFQGQEEFLCKLKRLYPDIASDPYFRVVKVFVEPDKSYDPCYLDGIFRRQKKLREKKLALLYRRLDYTLCLWCSFFLLDENIVKEGDMVRIDFSSWSAKQKVGAKCR